MTTEELLNQIRIPPEYAHIGDTPPQNVTDPSVRRWEMEAATRLRGLASHLAISGSLSTEEQSLVVLHVAQYVGEDLWISNDARSQAERACLLVALILRLAEAHTSGWQASWRTTFHKTYP